MTNRRGFLGLLANLPFVGALFRSEPEHHFGIDWGDGPSVSRAIIIEKPHMEYREVHSFMWIPLKDRLPGSSRLVLVCDCADGVIWVSPVDPGHEGFEEWVKEYHVTHWMDLPPRPLSATDNATGITEFNYPVTVTRKNGETVILDGRMRVEAAKASGLPVEMEFWN